MEKTFISIKNLLLSFCFFTSSNVINSAFRTPKPTPAEIIRQRLLNNPLPYGSTSKEAEHSPEWDKFKAHNRVQTGLASAFNRHKTFPAFYNIQTNADASKIKTSKMGYDGMSETESLPPSPEGPSTIQRKQDEQKILDQATAIYKSLGKSIEDNVKRKLDYTQEDSFDKSEETDDKVSELAIKNKQIDLAMNIDVKILAFKEALNYLIECYRISNLGNSDKAEILINAKLGKVQNLLTAIWYAPKAYLLFKDIKKINNLDKGLKAAFALDLLSNLSSFYFFAKDREISKNYKAISQYNKLNKRSLGGLKFIQYSWLSVNKLLPIAYFAYSRKYQDKSDYFEIFNTHSLNDSNKQSVFNYYMLNVAANLSEIARKYFRYKAEMGDYQVMLEDN